MARVHELARDRDDTAIAETLNRQGYRSAKGKAFTVSMIKWIRYRHRIPKPDLKRSEELTVAQVAEHFGVSRYVVYYWIEHDLLKVRRLNRGAPLWITLDTMTEQKLWDWVRSSPRIRTPQKSDALP